MTAPGRHFGFYYLAEEAIEVVQSFLYRTVFKYRRYVSIVACIVTAGNNILHCASTGHDGGSCAFAKIII